MLRRIGSSFAAIAAVSFGIAIAAMPASAQDLAKPSGAPTVTGRATVERIRFTAPSTVVQMKVEIVSEAGVPVFDVTSRGSVFDWAMKGGDGETVADGNYVCVITLKSVGGKLSQRVGSVSFADGRATIRSGARLTPGQEGAIGPIEPDSTIAVMNDDVPSTTVVGHDGKTGQITATTGDLTFRTGDVFSGTETERMRIKADGTVDVAGMLRAKDGYGFMNGSKLTVDENGTLKVTRANGTESPTVAGTGTQNRLAKWLETGGAGTLGDSLVFENGGFMGINTSTPGNLNGVQFATVPLHLVRLGNSAYMAVDAEGAGSYAGVILNRPSASANNHMWVMDSQPAPGASSLLAFSTYADNGTPTAKMSIKRTGEVNVGQTTGTAVGRPFESNTTGNLEAIRGLCLTAGQNCWSFYGFAAAGDRPGFFSGGLGVYVNSTDDTAPGIDANSGGLTSPALKGTATGGSSYGVDASSSAYRGGHIATTNASFFSLVAESPVGSSAGFNVIGPATINGNLTVTGSKSGFVVDVMQNVDSQRLEVGDVVVLTGNSAPVIGSIPTATVRKADTAYDTSVAGVVDAVWYVPDATTRKAYEVQQDAIRTAMAAQKKVSLDKTSGGDTKTEDVPIPPATISDMVGTVHPSDTEASASRGGYISVVTLGAYKSIKVDASFGPIKAGDLLTTSPNRGYAMKVTDRQAASGAIIGKALADLNTGTGLIPVLIQSR